MPALPFCHLCLKGKKPASPAYPKSLNTWGDHIRKRRLELGLRQRDVATQIGVDETTILNWERNARTPTCQYWPAIITLLGYNPLPEPKALPEQLVWYRKAKGLSQKRLAKHLRIDPSTLARWERGQRTPEGKYLKKLQLPIGRP